MRVRVQESMRRVRAWVRTGGRPGGGEGGGGNTPTQPHRIFQFPNPLFPNLIYDHLPKPY